jgi:hypothetical protein
MRDVIQDGHLRNRFHSKRSLPYPMNHTRLDIVLLTGNRDDGVMPLKFSDHRGESVCQNHLQVH